MVRLARLALGAGAAAAIALVMALPRALGLPIAARAPVAVHCALAFALGLRVEARGRLARSPSRLVVANHLSWLDIVALGALEPFAFVAKSELGASWPARALLALQGVLYVDRGRRSDIPRANSAILAALRHGAPVLLFAEGTTSDGNRLLPLRSSHFEAACGAAKLGEAVVQTVFIDYPRRVGLPVLRRERPAIAWYGDMAFWPHFLQVLRMGDLTCHVCFGEAIGVGRSGRKALAQEAERQLRQRCRRHERRQTTQ